MSGRGSAAGGAAALLARSGHLSPTDGSGAEEGPLGTPRGALTGPRRHLPLSSGPAASSSTAARLLRGRLTRGAGPGNEGQSPGSGPAKPRRSGGRRGAFRAARRTGAACSHSWPGPRRLRSPTALHEPSRHAKHRTPRSVAPPGRFDPARSQEPQQQNGGRGRSGRPPPPSLSALRVRTRGLRLPAAAGTLPVTPHGAANQERGRDGLGVRRSPQLPRSGRRWSRRRRRRALPSWAAVRRRGRCRCRVSPR